MGCDIHIVLERRREGSDRWIGEFTSDNFKCVGKNLEARNRDYGFFHRIAGVRGWGDNDKVDHYPKNLPRDVSDLAWDQYMTRPTDYHTPSHLTAEEFTAAYLAENPNSQTIRNDYAAYDLLGIDPDDKCEYRVVFWFDN